MENTEHLNLKFCPHSKNDPVRKLRWHTECPSCNCSEGKRDEGAGKLYWIKCLNCSKEFLECEGITEYKKHLELKSKRRR